MRTALSIFEAGKLVDAYHAKPSGLFECPECHEPVILVIKIKVHSRYFAHYRRRPNSPLCPRRISERYTSKYTKAVSKIFKKNGFREMLLICFGIAAIPNLVAPFKQSREKLVVTMQQVWQNKEQYINISDLLIPPPYYLRKWTGVGTVVQAHIYEREKNFPHLIPLYKSLKSKKHIDDQAITVFLLWRQLHMKQRAKDLEFLLQVSYHIYKRDMAYISHTTKSQAFYSMIAGHLMFNVLRILAGVPWAKADTLISKASRITCASCGESFPRVRAIRVRRCSVCGKPLCICCGEKYRCKKCYSDLCKGCAAKHVCSTK